MRRILLPLVLAAAMAGPGITGIGVAEAADATVTFTDRANPAALTVPSGTTVTFANESADSRRVRSKDGPAEFDSGNIEPGGSWSVVLHAAGTYPYVDERDRDDSAYHGTITVGTAGQPAGGSPPPGPAAPTPPATASVTILDRSFSPTTVTVAPGGTVWWTNQSDRDHTVTGGGFDSGVLGGGGSFSRTFPSAGTFAYICELHPEMRASVTVTSGGGAGAAPPVASPETVISTPAPAPVPGPSPSPPAVPGIAHAQRHDMAVVDYAFRPATLSARLGDTVVWTNQGRAPHTATAPGVFDTGLFRAGEQRTTRLRTAGTFTFRCTVHPEMTGELRVAPAAGGPTPATASPAAASASAHTSGTDGEPTTVTAPAAGAVPPEEDATPSTAEVSVVDFAFEPADVRLATGGTVTWQLGGSAPHTVSAAQGSFDSGLLAPGATFSHRFDEAGTYRYLCAFHPQMTGAIEVVEAPAGGSAGDPGAAGESGSAGDSGEQAAARLAGEAEPASPDWSSLLAALLAVAAILGGTGALLYGGSRMVAAGEGR